MAKYNPRILQNLENQATVVATINYNFEELHTLIDTLLSRDGKIPNTMQSSLDMNDYRVLNLPVPVSPTEPARHGDIQQYVDLAKGYAEDAEESAESAAEDAEETHHDLLEFQSEYLGAFSFDPVLDKNGNLIKDGAFYYNTTDGVVKVYSIRQVRVGLDRVVAGSFNVHADQWITLPVPAFQDLEDVDMDGANVGDFFQWTGTYVVPVTLTADYILQDNSVYNGPSVQDAIDDLANRTSLGIYDIYVFIQGLPGSNEECVRLVSSREFSVPVSGTGSSAICRVAPSGGSLVLSLQKNGVQFGTITFADSSTAGTFSVPGETTFQNGDLLTIKAPSSVNIAVRDISVTLACKR